MKNSLIHAIPLGSHTLYVSVRLPFQCFVCKQDINSHVIVFALYQHVCEYELSLVEKCVMVWYSSVCPVDPTRWSVSVLADISKCSRSGEAAKQDIPSLSYRLPLLLWQTHRDPSSPVLFLLFSLSSLTCFLGYNLTVFFFLLFPH